MLEPRRSIFFERREFVSDVVGIASDLVGDTSQFNSQKISHRRDEADRDQYYKCGADETAEVALEPAGDGTEHDA